MTASIIHVESSVESSIVSYRGLELHIAAATDVGRRRNNEDAFRVVYSQSSSAVTQALFVVADGIGGHENGEHASRIVVDTYEQDFLHPEAGKKFDLVGAALNAHGKIKEDYYGAGSTVVALLFDGLTAYYHNIGDSRLYVHNKEGLTQLTTDHSLVQELYDKGRITRGEMETYHEKQMLTLSIGNGNLVFKKNKIKQKTRPLAARDRYLLCSDGVTKMLSDHLIKGLLELYPNPEQAVRMLISSANYVGGRDNSTALVVDVTNPS